MLLCKFDRVLCAWGFQIAPLYIVGCHFNLKETMVQLNKLLWFPPTSDNSVWSSCLACGTCCRAWMRWCTCSRSETQNCFSLAALSVFEEIHLQIKELLFIYAPISGASVEKHFGAWLTWKNGSGGPSIRTPGWKDCFSEVEARRWFPATLRTLVGEKFFTLARHSWSNRSISHYLVLKEQNVGALRLSGGREKILFFCCCTLSLS